jgi:hypothetical protein
VYESALCGGFCVWEFRLGFSDRCGVWKCREGGVCSEKGVCGWN